MITSEIINAYVAYLKCEVQILNLLCNSPLVSFAKYILAIKHEASRQIINFQLFVENMKTGNSLHRLCSFVKLFGVSIVLK